MENYLNILQKASDEITKRPFPSLEVLEIFRPNSKEEAFVLAKTVSKISPLMGNMIEFKVCDALNKLNWGTEGKWVRQDPGFPDAIFKSEKVKPNPGIEIKAWMPLSTEITARFYESQNFFINEQTNIAIVAWLPEHLIWGKPKIIGVCVAPCSSVAKARDKHYHDLPDYLVEEPENTSDRTSNLQQTNVSGYKLQPTTEEVLKTIKEYVDGLGAEAKEYKPDREYQDKIKKLHQIGTYRLDTNFAKIDRIEHDGIEEFKKSILTHECCGKTISEWNKLLAAKTPSGEKDLMAELSKII